MTPAEQYAADLKAGTLQLDPGQQSQVEILNTLYHDLLQWQSEKNRLLNKFKRISPPQGWYCYGGVGIGKTYLMDLFFAAMQKTEIKIKRLHFHDFIRSIHAELTVQQGQRDPLEKIAKTFTSHCDVLCFDEFMVHDIADAMILARLLKHLFAHGLVLLATSNSAPDDLYPNGLQRQQFLPAIALLKQYCNVTHLQTLCDYRMQQLLESGVYFSPISPASNAVIQNCFKHLTTQRGVLDQTIVINDREIAARGLGSEVVWFDFKVLCSIGRSQHDYLAIAKLFHTVVLSGIPKLSEQDTDKVTLFIYLIDVFYDARIKMIFEAETIPAELYPAGRKKKDFNRTISRLHEMQSAQYLHSLVRSNLT